MIAGIKIFPACDRVLWVLFLLEADQTIYKGVLKLDEVRLAPTELMCYL